MSKYQVVENVCDNHISVRNDVDMHRKVSKESEKPTYNCYQRHSFFISLLIELAIL